MIKLIQVIQANQGNEYYLREARVNPSHIVSITPSDKFIMLLHQNQLPEGLDQHHEFVEISLSPGRTIIAVGNPKVINEKIEAAKKLLLG